MGRTNQTRDNQSCVNWSETQNTNAHHFELNYCRNLNNPEPWCYIANDRTWQYCNVPPCSKFTLTLYM